MKSNKKEKNTKLTKKMEVINEIKRLSHALSRQGEAISLKIAKKLNENISIDAIDKIFMKVKLKNIDFLDKKLNEIWEQSHYEYKKSPDKEKYEKIKGIFKDIENNFLALREIVRKEKGIIDDRKKTRSAKDDFIDFKDRENTRGKKSNSYNAYSNYNRKKKRNRKYYNAYYDYYNKKAIMLFDERKSREVTNKNEELTPEKKLLVEREKKYDKNLNLACTHKGRIKQLFSSD